MVGGGGVMFVVVQTAIDVHTYKYFYDSSRDSRLVRPAVSTCRLRLFLLLLPPLLLLLLSFTRASGCDTNARYGSCDGNANAVMCIRPTNYSRPYSGSTCDNKPPPAPRRYHRLHHYLCSRRFQSCQNTHTLQQTQTNTSTQTPTRNTHAVS